VPLDAFVRPLGKKEIKVSLALLKTISQVAFTLRLTKLSPDWIIAAETDWHFDTSRARDVLGWQPKHDLETTINDMVNTLKTAQGIN